MRSSYPILAASIACTGGTPGGPGVEIREEATGIQALRPLDPDDAVVTTPEGLVSLRADTMLDPTVAPVVAAARHFQAVVATEGELLAGDAGLLPSPLGPELPGPVTELVSAGTALWLRSDGSWWVHTQNHLFHPMVDGSPLGGALTAGHLDGVPVAWATVPGGLLALADSADGPVVVVRTDVTAEALAGSTEGLWAVADGRLELFDGASWHRVARDVTAVAAHPDAPGAWIATADGPAHVRWIEGRAETVPAPEVSGDWRGCDVGGRLWTLDASGVARRAAAVPVALISGLADGAVLGAPTTVRVDVSHPRVVESVELLVDGRAVALGIDSTGLRAALLDPSALEAGEHEAVVRATWTSDGEPLAFEGTPVRFTAAASGPITWLDNVEPLHRARCAICHDNGTETILADRDAWVANVDRILTEVEAARMPLGGDPLDEATIGVIRTWRDTDFP